MFNSSVLETAIGLVSCYAAVSLLTSSVYEALASYLGLRAKSLLSGIRSLLNEVPNQKLPKLTLAIYNHALIHPRGGGQAEKLSDLKQLPSYVDATHFAQALMASWEVGSAEFDKLGIAIKQLQDPQLRQLLWGLYHRPGQTVAGFQQAVANWFDASMDRISGEYKRNAQAYCFLIALIIAGLFNIDTFTLVATFWQHPDSASHITITAQTADEARKYLQTLSPLPVGWISPPWDQKAEVLLLQFGGWFVTATSVLFGAPFWFDLLQRFVQIRGTGNKPEQRSEASAQ